MILECIVAILAWALFASGITSYVLGKKLRTRLKIAEEKAEYVAELETELRSLSMHYEDKQGSIERLQDMLGERAQTIVDLMNDGEQMSSDLDDMLKQFDESNKEIEFLRSQVKERESQIENQRITMEHDRHVFDSRVKNINETADFRVKGAHTARDNTVKRYKELETRYENLKSEYESLTDESIKTVEALVVCALEKSAKSMIGRVRDVTRDFRNKDKKSANTLAKMLGQHLDTQSDVSVNNRSSCAPSRYS